MKKKKAISKKNEYLIECDCGGEWFKIEWENKQLICTECKKAHPYKEEKIRK